MSIIIDNAIERIVDIYNLSIRGIDQKATLDKHRAYGGMIRANKGKLVENISEIMIETAWKDLGGSGKDLKINSNKIKIPIQKEFIEKIEDDELRKYCLKNYYKISVDKHAFIKNEFVLGIECKSFTENAMLKRILFDFYLLKTIHPNITCYLLQLESQLGGDFSECKQKTFGSPSTNTLLSYFPNIDLHIFTLVKGERKVDKPIHKPGFFKPIDKNQIRKALGIIKNDLQKYL